MSAGQVVYDMGNWRLGDDGRIYRRGRMKYSNGDIYDGEWMDGKRHGKGTFVFHNGDRYIGEFENDFFTGFGVHSIARSQHPLTRVWRKAERYEGHFKHGKRHGKGLYVSETGNSYNGSFVEGYFEGHGTYTYANGDVYDGDWLHGKWHGKGELRMKDGSMYVGEFKNGKFHRFGKLLYGVGGQHGSYFGEYLAGKRHGKGVRVFGSGAKYDGQWQNDQMWGFGTLEKPMHTISKAKSTEPETTQSASMAALEDDKDIKAQEEATASLKYVGEFRKGLYNGHGAITLPNGDYYEGSFVDGYFYGKGVYTFFDGGFYDGEYLAPTLDGLRHGTGKRVWKSGGVYQGEWVADQMHGRGVLTREVTCAKGTKGHYKYDGEFVQGFMTGSACISYEHDSDYEVEYEFPIGSGFWHRGRGKCTYQGTMLRGEFHGQGTLMSPDGQLWRGQWHHGKLCGAGEHVALPKIYALLQERQERESKYGRRPRSQKQLHKATGGSSTHTPEADEDMSLEARERAIDAFGIRDITDSLLKMHRVVKYIGEFVDNQRHGHGQLLFVNGDTIEGTFERGFACGLVLCAFGRSEVTRYAHYNKGQRLRWLTTEEEAPLRQAQLQREQEHEEKKRLVGLLMGKTTPAKLSNQNQH